MPLGASGCWELLDGDKGTAVLESGVAWEGGRVIFGCAAVAQKVSFPCKCVCVEQGLGAVILAKPRGEFCLVQVWCLCGSALSFV